MSRLRSWKGVGAIAASISLRLSLADPYTFYNILPIRFPKHPAHLNGVVIVQAVKFVAGLMIRLLLSVNYLSVAVNLFGSIAQVLGVGSVACYMGLEEQDYLVVSITMVLAYDLWLLAKRSFPFMALEIKRIWKQYVWSKRLDLSFFKNPFRRQTDLPKICEVCGGPKSKAHVEPAEPQPTAVETTNDPSDTVVPEEQTGASEAVEDINGEQDLSEIQPEKPDPSTPEETVVVEPVEEVEDEQRKRKTRRGKRRATPKPQDIQEPELSAWANVTPDAASEWA